jgi:hypothetical protein
MAQDPLKILKSAAQIVTFLLAAFGGFLRGIAPPEETRAALALGLSSFLCLILFLLVTALAQTLTRRFWLVASAAAAVSLVVATIVYQRQSQELTFVWAPSGDTYVIGDGHLTPKAAEARQHDPSLTNYDLVAGFGGIDKTTGIDRRNAVWPESAILSASRQLTFDYLWVVLSAAVAVFCAIEGVMRAPPMIRPRRQALRPNRPPREGARHDR